MDGHISLGKRDDELIPKCKKKQKTNELNSTVNIRTKLHDPGEFALFHETTLTKTCALCREASQTASFLICENKTLPTVKHKPKSL